MMVMGKIYSIDCMGYKGRFGDVPTHKYLSSTDLMEGSTGLCGDCKNLYLWKRTKKVFEK